MKHAERITPVAAALSLLRFDDVIDRARETRAVRRAMERNRNGHDRRRLHGRQVHGLRPVGSKLPEACAIAQNPRGAPSIS
jgi:hypothetical protein